MYPEELEIQCQLLLKFLAWKIWHKSGIKEHQEGPYLYTLLKGSQLWGVHTSSCLNNSQDRTCTGNLFQQFLTCFTAFFTFWSEFQLIPRFFYALIICNKKPNFIFLLDSLQVTQDAPNIHRLNKPSLLGLSHWELQPHSSPRGL